MATDKYPWFKFYRRDWSHHPNLRRCGRAARSLWIDLICLAYECEEPGVFATGGKPWPDEEVAGAVDGGTDVNLPLLLELLAKGVAKRRIDGAIYSSRVVHDVEVRDAHAKAGSSGGLAKSKQTSSKPPSKRSVSVSESDSLLLREIPEGLNSSPMRDAVAEWAAHRREIKKPWTARMARTSFRQWQECGWAEARIIAAIRHSMANGWQGIHEPASPAGRINRETDQDAKRGFIASLRGKESA